MQFAIERQSGSWIVVDSMTHFQDGLVRDSTCVHLGSVGETVGLGPCKEQLNVILRIISQMSVSLVHFCRMQQKS